MTRVSRIALAAALASCGRSDPSPPAPTAPADRPAPPAEPAPIDVPAAIALTNQVPLLPRAPRLIVVDGQVGDEQRLISPRGDQELPTVFEGEAIEALRPRFQKGAWCSVPIAVRFHDPEYSVVSRAPSSAPVMIASLNAEVAPGEHDVDIVATVAKVHACHACPEGAMCKKCYESFTLAELPGATIDGAVTDLSAGARIEATLRVTVRRASAEVRGACR